MPENIPGIKKRALSHHGKLVSVVVPIHNEEEGIKAFLEDKLFVALKQIDRYNTEVILVNDGSTDHTLQILQELAEADKTIKLISFSRNFGKEIALAAGINQACGDAVITIDADGQQPPEIIPEFIAKWESGAEIVTGVRSKYTRHGLIQKIGSKVFYWTLRKMGNKTTVPNSTDFRLLDRVVVEEYNKLTEHHRITRGLIDWLGFKQDYVEYVYGVRMAGRPSYSLSKLFKLAIDSFVSMSTTPMIIFGYLGILISVSSFLLGTFCIVNQYILGDPLGLYWNGSIQLAIFITFLVGLVLTSQSATALYISQIHAETQNRPLYIIDHKNSRNIE